MFQVRNALIAHDVAHAKFACNLTACKGACCVVGNAGAPLEKNEIHHINKAWSKLVPTLRDRAREVVNEYGTVRSRNGNYELNCTDDAECIFVTYTENKVAICAIQQAYDAGEFDWPKPISCHLFPLRIKRVGTMDFINYEYVPSICSPACTRGKKEGIFLSDFLKDALIRKYSADWYEEFQAACHHIRKEKIGLP